MEELLIRRTEELTLIPRDFYEALGDYCKDELRIYDLVNEIASKEEFELLDEAYRDDYGQGLKEALEENLTPFEYIEIENILESKI